MNIITNKSNDTNSIPIGYNDTKTFYTSSKKGVENGIKSIKSDTPITPIPYINIKNNQRSAVYISAPSGAGKSTLASKFIKEYRELLGKKFRTILITGNSLDDPTFTKIKGLIIIKIRDVDGFDEVRYTDLSDSLVIFDDFESLDKDKLKKVLALIKDLLELGRKQNSHCIVITHQTQQYNLTKPIIYECDTYCLSPASNPNAVKKFLIAHCDMDKKEALNIIDKCSQQFGFLIIHKAVPRYYMTDNIIQLI